MRIVLVGFGTVGQWLAHALDAGADRLLAQYGVRFTVVGLANARDGFVYAPEGIELASALALAAAGRSNREVPGVRHWPTAIDGLRATDADVLVEVSASPPRDGEPGFSHMRVALESGASVVTSNKWPVALHGVELAALARERALSFHAESTVMSGTPVLRALIEGLAGATPMSIRGLLNATVNFILSRMSEGVSYADALAEAQAAGLAERDPAADVGGQDSVAKLMILAALVFGRQLRPEQVECRGIAALDPVEFERAAAARARVKHVATLGPSPSPSGDGTLTASVRPQLVGAEDPLASVEGATNALVCSADPVGQITITGPGAGPELAGQGVLSDLIAVARRRERATPPLA